jgi:geranylgeranyl diphosphate synthase, type I
MLTIDRERKKLIDQLQIRSQTVLEKFKQTTTSNLSYPELITMLETVNGYWHDYQRPALAQLSCEAVGGNPKNTDDAILMVSLAAAGMGIHDDILDKSDYKHFRKTILGRYKVDNALLVGDLIIIKGLLAAHEYLDRTCPQNCKRQIFESLQNFIFEIYEGEIMDITCRKKLSKPQFYESIMYKLATDGEACARIGAILGGGSVKEIKALSIFGRNLAFILNLGEEVKDTLNQEGNLSHRLKYESVPLPILKAAEVSPDAAVRLELILRQPECDENTEEIRMLCWQTHSMTYVFGLGKKYGKEALAALETLTTSSARDSLIQQLKGALKYLKKASEFEKTYLKCFG